MSNSTHLTLPFILPAQAQKHVTHNEALRALDVVVQLSVLDRNLAAPPATPADGDRYIVATGASGAWADRESQIAAWQDGAWAFHAPDEGWLCWVADEDALLVWSGTAWVAVLAGGGGGGSGGNGAFDTMGVSATADANNRLAVSSAATLLNHAGAGHQVKINKAAAADTASLLFQTAFSGRAEMGTAGDDDFRFKVSADGVAWNDAIVIARASGVVSLPSTPAAVGNSADLRRNVSWLALLRAADQGVSIGLSNEVCSGGESGIDMVASTGELYDILGKFHAPAETPGANQIPHMTAATTSGVTMSASSQFDANYVPWFAGDNNAATRWATVTGGLPAWLRIQFATAKVIASVKIQTVDTSASLPQSPRDFTIEGSVNGTAWTTLLTVTGSTGWTVSQVREFTIPPANRGSYLYYRLHITADNGGNLPTVARIEMMSAGVPSAMDLRSAAFTAAFAPTVARLLLQIDDAGALPNTDFRVHASRNAGTNWTEGVLVKRDDLTFGGAIEVYEAENISLSGQPAGTAMRWRLTTHNGAAPRVYARSLGWSL